MEDLKKHAALGTLVLGCLLSTFTGVLLHKSGVSAVDSTVIALLGSTLTALFGIFIDTRMNQDKTMDALGISRHFNRDDNLRDNIYHLTNNYASITSRPREELFVREAERTITNCVGVIDGLAKGRFDAKTEGKRFRFVLAKTNDPAVKSFKIVTWLSKSEPGWWEGPHGKQYIEDQRKAILRGAEITRILIIPENPPEDLERLISAQKDAGIEVIQVPEQGLAEDLCVNMVICDDTWYTEAKYHPSGRHRGGPVSADNSDVFSAREKWDDLMDIARPGSG
jgi:hypothetical protein